MTAIHANAPRAVSTTVDSTSRTQEPAEFPQGPRLAPVERPAGLRLRFAYWGMRHWMGKVLTPAKVLFARVPEVMPVVSSMQKFQAKGVRLEPSLQVLIADLTSQINGCSFCEDIGRAMAIRKKLDLDRKLDAVLRYRTDPAFTDRERAALAYVEEATRNKRVADETFAALREQFTEREIVEITLLNAIENLYNLTNLPLGIGSDGLCALARPGSDAAGTG
jgi:alkylhydroperoxidase family enzyme